jgi:CheY-like chemotaxis protein
MARPSRIVLVDDNPGDLELFAEALVDSDWNAELEAHRTGEAAIDSLRRQAADGHRPDLIILDYLLLGEHCVHTLAIIRAIPAFDQVAVIIYSSAMPTAAMIQECAPFGVLRVLEKPQDFTGTISLVRVLKAFLVGNGSISVGGSWKGGPAGQARAAGDN